MLNFACILRQGLVPRDTNYSHTRPLYYDGPIYESIKRKSECILMGALTATHDDSSLVSVRPHGEDECRMESSLYFPSPVYSLSDIMTSISD